MKGSKDKKAKAEINVDDAAHSAVLFLENLENSFHNADPGIDMYHVLGNSLQGGQKVDADVTFSGRLFFNNDISFNKNGKYPNQKAFTITQKDKDQKNSNIYNFMSKPAVKQVKEMYKNPKDKSTIKPFFDSLVLGVEHNPEWQKFWGSRQDIADRTIPIKDGDNIKNVTLYDCILQAFIYKQVTESYGEYAKSLNNTAQIKSSQLFLSAMQAETKSVHSLTRANMHDLHTKPVQLLQNFNQESPAKLTKAIEKLKKDVDHTTIEVSKPFNVEKQKDIEIKVDDLGKRYVNIEAKVEKSKSPKVKSLFSQLKESFKSLFKKIKELGFKGKVINIPSLEDSNQERKSKKKKTM